MKRFFFLFLFLTIPSLGFSMTLDQIVKEVRYQIIDTTGTVNNPRWPNDIIIERVNIVQKQIAADTWCCYNKLLISPVTGQTEYTKPSDLIAIDRVTYLVTVATTSYKKLLCITMPGYDATNPFWENQAPGMPLRYYERGAVIGLNPTPGAGWCWPNALKIDYYCFPADVSSASDIPFNGQYDLYPYHQYIIWLVSAWLKVDEGRISTLEYETERNALMTMMKSQIHTKPDYQGKLQWPGQPQ